MEERQWWDSLETIVVFVWGEERWRARSFTYSEQWSDNPWTAEAWGGREGNPGHTQHRSRGPFSAPACFPGKKQRALLQGPRQATGQPSAPQQHALFSLLQFSMTESGQCEITRRQHSELKRIDRYVIFISLSLFFKKVKNCLNPNRKWWFPSFSSKFIAHLSQSSPFLLCFN